MGARTFPNITLGIYEDEEVQAFATIWNDFYVIGISSGFLNQLYDVLLIDFNQIESFKKIPEPEKKIAASHAIHAVLHIHN